MPVDVSERDPITRELIKNALASLVDEMAYTVIQTAHSELVKDVMDFSTAVCDADGQMLAQGKTIALHLGAVPDAMASVKAAFEGQIFPGDVFVMNDPYEGGMHLPDVFMFRPVFDGEVRIGWSVAIAHQTDMGGRVPGSNASDSTEIYQEGLRIPPVKFYERGTPNITLLRILRKNVRVPERVVGDWNAQLSACLIGERGLQKLFRQYGLADLNGYFNDLLDYSERLVRQEIARWPDGRYEFTDYVDDDGFSSEPIPISVAITVEGDSLTVDYTGTSRQVKGALNSVFAYTKSCTYLSVRCMMREDVPNNVGVFRPIRVIAPPGTIVNPDPPAACAARALTGYRIVDAMFGALAQIVPDRVPAAGEGGNTVVCISGRRADGSQFIIVDMLCGAWGGRPTKDGIDGVTNPSQNLSNAPIEVLEAQHPILITRYGFVPDTAGAGQYRGGLSLERNYRLLADEALLQLRADRMTFRPYGLRGGEPGAPSRNTLMEEDGSARELPSKVTMTMSEGQEIHHAMPGGGGYGDPFKRDPELIAADVIDGKISPDYAYREHGVVIDQRGIVDVDATVATRARERPTPAASVR